MVKDPLKFSEAHRSQSGSWSDGCLLSLDPTLHWPLSPSVSYITSHIRVWLFCHEHGSSLLLRKRWYPSADSLTPWIWVLLDKPTGSEL